ncbi:MAG: hypothetical protein K9G00_03415 [Pontimonas sp.]|nr:hypothetical protein [Pontimonas sp.]
MTVVLSPYFSNKPLGACPIVSDRRRWAVRPVVESIVLMTGIAAGMRREEAGFSPS